jgi:hypothetical protein
MWEGGYWIHIEYHKLLFLYSKRTVLVVNVSAYSSPVITVTNSVMSKQYVYNN